jgi:hypothetical protein
MCTSPLAAHASTRPTSCKYRTRLSWAAATKCNRHCNSRAPWHAPCIRMQLAPAMHWNTACNIHHALYTTALGTHRRGHAAMRYGRLACQACAPPPTWSRPAHCDLPQRSPCQFCLERTCTRRQDGAQGCRMIGCSAPVAAATVSGVTRRAARAPCKPRDAMIAILRQSMRRLRPADTSVRASEVRMIRPAAPIFVGRACSRRQRLQGPQPHRGRACNDLREAHRRPVASVPLMSPVSSPLINRIADRSYVRSGGGSEVLYQD